MRSWDPNTQIRLTRLRPMSSLRSADLQQVRDEMMQRLVACWRGADDKHLERVFAHLALWLDTELRLRNPRRRPAIVVDAAPRQSVSSEDK